MGERSMETCIQERLDTLRNAIRLHGHCGYTLQAWYDDGALVGELISGLEDHNGTDRNNAVEAWGYLQGVADCLDLTVLEMLSEHGLSFNGYVLAPSTCIPEPPFPAKPNMTQTNRTYSAASGDGTVCSEGMTRRQAERRAQEIANQTGEAATVQSSDGEEWSVKPKKSRKTRKASRNWVVVVGTNKDGTPVYLGTFNVDADVSNGSSVKEVNRCGVTRLENALRFSERGAKRLAAGYSDGRALQA